MKNLRRLSAENNLPFNMVLSLGINLIIELLSRKSLIGLAAFIFTRPLIFFYNTLIILLTLSIANLVKRRTFARALIAIIWITLGVVNSVLLLFRVTPFTAVDLRLAKYAISIADNYLNLIHVVFIGIGAAAVLAGIVILWRKAPKMSCKVPYLWVTAGVLLLGLMVTGCTEVGLRSNILARNFGNIAMAYQDYGFAYCFSNSLINTGISKPKDYNEEVVDEISREEILPEETIPVVAGTEDVKGPNIIFVQLESFFDPTSLEDVTFSQDPTPNFRRFQEEFTAGHISVPSVGAGTANTEFEIISGMNLDFFGPGEYPYKTILQKSVCESISFNLKELGYRTHAIHNNEGTFYDRHMVFSQLGFDTFTPIEYMNGIEENPIGWAKDEVLIGEITKALKSSPESDFVYTISVQGHGAYPEDQLLTDPVITVSGEGVAEESRKNQIEYYVNEMHEMDLFVKDLVAALDQSGEEYVLVMYGDHLPTLDITEEELANGNLFQTPYVMVNNIGLEKVDRDIEAFQLTSYILNQMNIHKGTMIRYHQKYLQEKKPDEELYLDDMQILEYDMLYGDYEVYGGELPYEATDLQLGIDTILVNGAEYKDGSLYIYGENFTEYSKVYLNGKEVASEFVHPNQLKAVIERPDDEVEIVVKQVGKDKMPLGSSNLYKETFE